MDDRDEKGGADHRPQNPEGMSAKVDHDRQVPFESDGVPYFLIVSAYRKHLNCEILSKSRLLHRSNTEAEAVNRSSRGLGAQWC